MVQNAFIPDPTLNIGMEMQNVDAIYSVSFCVFVRGEVFNFILEAPRGQTELYTCTCFII